MEGEFIFRRAVRETAAGLGHYYSFFAKDLQKVKLRYLIYFSLNGQSEATCINSDILFLVSSWLLSKWSQKLLSFNKFFPHFSESMISGNCRIFEIVCSLCIVVYGRYTDIPAIAFFYIQTDLVHRKLWDSNTAEIRQIDNTANSTDTEVVYWRVNMPVPLMADRDYVYTRRYV